LSAVPNISDLLVGHHRASRPFVRARARESASLSIFQARPGPASQHSRMNAQARTPIGDVLASSSLREQWHPRNGYIIETKPFRPSAGGKAVRRQPGNAADAVASSPRPNVSWAKARFPFPARSPAMIRPPDPRSTNQASPVSV